MRGYVDNLSVDVSIHCPVRTDAGSMVLKVATVETAWEGRGGVECEFLGLVLFAHTRAEQHGRSGFYTPHSYVSMNTYDSMSGD